MQRGTIPEILAPAGSFDSLRAAVQAGCDAVYLGGSNFGARAYADNFSQEELIGAIEYCHLREVKIYLTINTLLKENELADELYGYLLPFYEAGIDAVIVQDVGVLKRVHEWFPDLPIHASTQMTIVTGMTAEFLADYGVTRIVPARELTAPELLQMRRDTGLEIEVFVHGALCYCYSGQCLFSSFLGGRSGNRGRCAGPCRMPYKIDGIKSRIGEYLLSPKELCNLPVLGLLMEAGVDSFKIEGRMKRPEYVAQVTAIYKKYRDLHLQYGPSYEKEYLSFHREEWEEDLRSLAELYNRTGFTHGYLEGECGTPEHKPDEKRAQMLSAKRPRHGGVRVGRVVGTDRHTVTFSLERDIHAQDVLEFRDNRMIPSYEYTVGDSRGRGDIVTGRYQKGCHIRVGDTVYRTKDAVLLEQIRQSYLEREPKLTVQGSFSGEPEKPCSLKLSYGKVEVCAEGEICQTAKSRPLLPEQVRKSISQTGDSEFSFGELDIRLSDNLFLPVSALKQLRRKALGMLREALLSGSRRKASENGGVADFPLAGIKSQRKLVKIVSVMNRGQLEAVLGLEEVAEIYIRMEQMEAEQLADCCRLCHDNGKKAYLVLPHIFRRWLWDKVSRQVEDGGGVWNADWDGFLIRNMESFLFLRDVCQVPPEKIIPDSNLYIMNTAAYVFWREQGVEQFTLPLELNRAELGALAGIAGAQMIVYTHVPLMVSSQCTRFHTEGCRYGDNPAAVRKELTDGRGRQFVVINTCKYCYNTIYQGIAMNLTAQEAELRGMGICSMRYDFYWERPEQIRRILAQEDSGLPTETGHYYSGIE